MSISLMTLVWPLRLSQTQKGVLLSMADNANDDGFCWPSLETIATRVCVSSRAVTNAIADLEALGFLVANRENGRKTTYQIQVLALEKAQNHRTTFTPEPRSPLNEVLHTPERRSTHPRTTFRKPPNDVPTNHNEPSITIIEPSVTRSPKTCNQVAKPDDVSKKVWSDFLALRKAKRAPLTETALDGIQREARKAGICLEIALETCCLQGWQGFRADWYENATRTANRAKPSASDFERAKLEGQAWAHSERTVSAPEALEGRYEPV